MNLLVLILFLSILTNVVSLTISYPFKKLQISEKDIQKLFQISGILSLIFNVAYLFYGKSIELNLLGFIDISINFKLALIILL